MAGNTISIALVANAKPAVAAFDDTGTAAKTMASKVDDADKSVKSMGDKFDETGSKTSQLAGGLGDLGGALSAMPGPIGAIGTGLETAAPFVMGMTGAMDLLNLAANSNIVTSVKQVAATVASRTAMVAGAVATGVMTAAQWALNAAMSLNPIGLVIIAIVALVAVFVIAYKKSETFRKIVNAAWTGIKVAAVAVFNFLKGYFVAVFNVYKAVFMAGIAAFKRIWEGLKAIGTFVQGVWNSVVGFFRTGVTNAVGVVKGLKDKVKGAISGAIGWLTGVGKDIMNGLISGINTGLQWVRDKVGALGNLLPGWLKSVLGISSPSKVFAKIGEQTIEGFAQGFESIGGKDMAKGLAKDLTRATPTLEGTMSLSADALGRSGGATTVIEVHNHFNGLVADPVGTVRQIQKTLDQAMASTGRGLRVTP